MHTHVTEGEHLRHTRSVFLYPLLEPVSQVRPILSATFAAKTLKYALQPMTKLYIIFVAVLCVQRCLMPKLSEDDLEGPNDPRHSRQETRSICC